MEPTKIVKPTTPVIDNKIEYTTTPDGVGICDFSMYVRGRRFNQTEIYKLLLKQVEAELTVNTHSKECWKWHHECAKQRLDAIRTSVLQLVG